MRHLYLLRHAKSDWSGDYAGDRERPLAPRGERAAATMGRFLNAARQAPDLVVSSPAVRARRTVEIAATEGGWRCSVEIADELYGGSTEDLLEVVRSTGTETGRLLLAGHEPTWSAAVGRWIGSGSVRMVTAALARIDLPLDDWTEARWGAGTLAWLCTPKLLQRFDDSVARQESR